MSGVEDSDPTLAPSRTRLTWCCRNTTSARRSGAPLVRDIFDRTAGDYDRVERPAAFGAASRYRRQLSCARDFRQACAYSMWRPEPGW